MVISGDVTKQKEQCGTFYKLVTNTPRKHRGQPMGTSKNYTELNANYLNAMGDLRVQPFMTLRFMVRKENV